MTPAAPHWRATVARRLALDLPDSFPEAADRLARAAKRHETWICAALATGICVEIWIGLIRTAALYPVGP